MNLHSLIISNIFFYYKISVRMRGWMAIFFYSVDLFAESKIGLQIPLVWDTADMQIKTRNYWKGPAKRFLQAYKFLLNFL